MQKVAGLGLNPRSVTFQSPCSQPPRGDLQSVQEETYPLRPLTTRVPFLLPGSPGLSSTARPAVKGEWDLVLSSGPAGL